MTFNLDRKAIIMHSSHSKVQISDIIDVHVVSCYFTKRSSQTMGKAILRVSSPKFAEYK